MRYLITTLFTFFTLILIGQELSTKGSWSSANIDLCNEEMLVNMHVLKANSLNKVVTCFCDELENLYDSYLIAAHHILSSSTEEFMMIASSCIKEDLNREKLAQLELLVKSNADSILFIIENEYGKESEEYLICCSWIVSGCIKEINYPDAVTIAIEMIDISAKIFGKESLIYFHSVNKLALAYQYLNPDKALNIYLENNDLAEKILKVSDKALGLTPKQEYLTFKMNMGITYYKLFKYDEALYIYNELGKMKIDNNRAFLTLQRCIAEIKRSKGNLNEALSISLENLKNTESNFGKNDPDYISSLNNLALTYMDLTNYEKSLEFFLRAHKMSKKISSSSQYLYLLNNMGILYMQMNSFEKALSCLKEYQQIQTDRFKAYESSLNTDLREYLFQDLLRVYYDVFLIPSALKDKELINEQYDHYCFLKGRELSQSKQLSLLVEGSSDNVLIRTYHEWIRKKKELSNAYELSMQQIITHHGIDYLNQLQKDADILEMQLSSFRSINQNYTFQDIKSNLEKDEVYIDIVNVTYKNPYNVDGKESLFDMYYAYIIKRDALAPELIKLHTGDILEEALEKYNSNINMRKKLSDLDWKYCFDHFWGKLQPYTKNMSTVYFSNAGVYNKINLNTLYDYNSDVFLNDSKHIIYSTNSEHFINQKRSLNFVSERNNLDADAVLIGNPTYLLDDQQIANIKDKTSVSGNSLLASRASSRGNLWGNLPGTQVEIDSISSILISNNWDVQLICRENAIESAVKKISAPTVLHIATHGFFSEDGQLTTRSRSLGIKDQSIKVSPLINSALVFAGANNTGNGDVLPSDNGFLNAYEASFLELRGTELVVLSACETGLGNIKNGKGVFGLQRAIQIAGAESIIISMWKVSDNATQKLMRYFYDSWIEKGMNKRQAFNSAKYKLREEYSHPYFWGAFIFLGN